MLNDRWQRWMRLLGGFAIKLGKAFRWRHDALCGYDGPDLLESLEDARREWRYARMYFNSVSDPDLIDHAVFYLGATEKKYIYLLKQAKENGLNVEPLLL